MAPRRGKEHDFRKTIRLYKDAIREDAIEFVGPFSIFVLQLSKRRRSLSMSQHIMLAIWIMSFVLTSVTRNLTSARRIIGMFVSIVQVYPRLRFQRM